MRNHTSDRTSDRTVLIALFAVYVAAGCTLSNHPVVTADHLPATVPRASAMVQERGPIVLESVVSARWAVPASGLINLDHPIAQQAGLTDREIPIVLPVHVLTHPTRGIHIIDTGITRDRAAGGHGAVKGLVRGHLEDIEPVEPIGDILARQSAPLAGVLLTHAHIDHVLGLPDIPSDTPVYMGPGELGERGFMHMLTRSTYNALFEGRQPARALRFDDAPKSAAGLAAIDLLGDGSLWALHCPGHTSGSLAFLANTTTGPALFTGDTSHTRWGWENGVEPGTYTSDHQQNAVSLAALKALVAAHPEIRVYVGHELNG